MVLKNSNTDSLETLARLKLRQSSKPEADRYFTARSRFSILPIIRWTKDDDDYGDVDSLGNYHNHANHDLIFECFFRFFLHEITL